MNVSWPDEMKAFVEQQASQGGFSTVSEFIRALVRDAQKGETKERLERQLLEGLDSGPAQPLTEADWANVRRRAKARLDAEKRR